VIASASQKGVGAASGLQIALFDEHHSPVSTAVSGESGEFGLKDVAPGRYTLVVANDAFHPLSIPLQVGATASASTVPDPALLLYLRFKTDRRRSRVAPIASRSLRNELLQWVKEDQDIRNEAIKHGIDHPDKEIQARWEDIDARNLAHMREIVRKYGWPGPGLVGVDGTEAAFLLLQHSPLDFQQMLLPRIRKAYLAGQLHGQDYALLLDRVLAHEGKPQVYGTQAKGFAEWHNREPAFYPIEDEAHVDRRRAAVGLPPLAAYAKMLQSLYFPHEKDKSDKL
jgi:hypothetical protein